MPTEEMENQDAVLRFPGRGVIRGIIILAVWLTALCLFTMLMHVFMPGLSPNRGAAARPRAARAQIAAFAQALDLFSTDNGGYPCGSNALQALMTAPVGATNWHQYLDSIPLDPWGHAYVYECPGRHRTNSYDLFSMGPDGRAGTDDDIRNW
jgi:general secretion pathway protein G